MTEAEVETWKKKIERIWESITKDLALIQGEQDPTVNSIQFSHKHLANFYQTLIVELNSKDPLKKASIEPKVIGFLTNCYRLKIAIAREVKKRKIVWLSHKKGKKVQLRIKPK